MFSGKNNQTAKCPDCTVHVTLTVMAMHQHMASVHYMKSQRKGGICVTAVRDHDDCPPTTTCLLREARKFVREREMQPAPAAVLLPTSQPPTAEPSLSMGELRELLIQANKTNKALSARLDILTDDADRRVDEISRSLSRSRDARRGDDSFRSLSRSRDTQRGDDSFRSLSRSRGSIRGDDHGSFRGERCSRGSIRGNLHDRFHGEKRSRGSIRCDESFRSEGPRQRGATPADDVYMAWPRDKEREDNFYIGWARDIERDQTLHTVEEVKAEEEVKAPHTHVRHIRIYVRIWHTQKQLDEAAAKKDEKEAPHISHTYLSNQSFVKPVICQTRHN